MEEEKKEEADDTHYFGCLFRERLKDEKSVGILRKLTKLLKEEIKNDEKERDNLINKRKEEFIQEFIDIWNISNSKEKDCVRNNMENLIMRNVYDNIFCRSTEEKESSILFLRHMGALSSFIQPSHLEVNPKSINSMLIQTASSKLEEIHSYKTPGDKLIIITNFCKLISRMSILGNWEGDPSLPSKPDQDIEKNLGEMGADSLFPLLVLMVIKAHTPLLRCNIQYIQKFRSVSLISGQEEYFLTAIYSAVQFIQNITSEHLSMSPSEFQSLYAQNIKIQDAKMLQMVNIYTPPSKGGGDNSISYLSEVLEKDKKESTKELKMFRRMKTLVVEGKNKLNGSFSKLSINELHYLVNLFQRLCKIVN